MDWEEAQKTFWHDKNIPYPEQSMGIGIKSLLTAH